MYTFIVMLIQNTHHHFPLLSQRHSQGFWDAVCAERHLQSRKTGELFKKMNLRVSSGVSLHFHLNKSIVHTHHQKPVSWKCVCSPGRCSWTGVHICVRQLDQIFQQDEPGTWNHSKVMSYSYIFLISPHPALHPGRSYQGFLFQILHLFAKLCMFPITDLQMWILNTLTTTIKMFFAREPNQRLRGSWLADKGTVWLYGSKCAELCCM